MKYKVTFVRELEDIEVLMEGVIDTDFVSSLSDDIINPNYSEISLCGIAYTIVRDEALIKFYTFDESSIA